LSGVISRGEAVETFIKPCVVERFVRGKTWLLQ
jgi:hypothetical protein